MPVVLAPPVLSPPPHPRGGVFVGRRVLTVTSSKAEAGGTGRGAKRAETEAVCTPQFHVALLIEQYSEYQQLTPTEFLLWRQTLRQGIQGQQTL